MTRQLSLFAPVGAAEPSEHVAQLGKKLPPRFYFGTSSWSFPGWQRIVYDKAVSKTVLARDGLAAYAEHPLLRSVGIDRTYYGPMSASELSLYRDAVPDTFRFVVKAHELITRATMRDDPWSENPLFLDPSYALEAVVGPTLEGLGDKLGVLLLQFPPQRIESVAAFIDGLHRLLEALPQGVVYAIELRNPEPLVPAYAQMLADTGASHCFNVHPTMPAIQEQLRQLAHPTSTLVVRWMLRRNRTYGDAKDAFHPFDKIAEPDDGSRDAVAGLCRPAKRAFVIVNNKAEGCAPLSLVRLAEALS